MTIYSRPNPAGYRADPTSGLLLDARSSSLITAGKYEMPLPTTDAEAVALGWPSLLTGGAVDGDLWLCDEASPNNLVGKVRGYQLAPTGGPLQNREFNGLPYGGTLWSKKAVEPVTGVGLRSRFQATDAAACDVALEDFTISLLIRTASDWGTPAGVLVCLWAKITAAVIGYWFTCDANQLYMGFGDGVGGSGTVADPVALFDGAVHLVTVSVDRSGNVAFYVDGNATVNGACPATATLTNADAAQTGSFAWWDTWLRGQIAWIYVNVGVAASRVGHDALWAALNSDWLGTDNTYARANPLTYPISASRVATAAANAFMPGYNANAAAGDNPLQLGVVCEDGISFEAVGSDNLNANTMDQGGDTHAQVDGPSGMRDAVRVLQGGAWAIAGNTCYIPTVAVPIVGASNVPWLGGWMYKRATVGTTARTGFYFSGDAGGPEQLAGIVDNATPIDWARAFAVVTPVRAGQVQFVEMFGANANGEDCDFGEPLVIKNRTTAPLAWRRVGVAAAASTATAALSIANAANARYSPARGRERVRIAGLARQEEQYIGAYACGATTRQAAFDGTNMWIACQGTNRVRKLVAATGAFVADYVTGAQPQGVCYDPTTNSIWIADYNGGGASNVYKLDAATGANLGVFNVGAGPNGICTDGTNIWVSCWVSNRVYKLLAATGGAVGNYATGVFPSGVCYANGSIWICNYNDNTVTKLTAATGALVGTYATGAGPNQVCYDGTNVWIANSGAQTVTARTEATGAIVATYTITPVGGSAGAVIFDGTYVWVASYPENNIRKVRISDGVVLATYGVGAGPVGMCWDGNNIWTQAITAATTTKIGARQVLLAFGAEGAAGSLWLDYAGDVSWVPLVGVTPQLRLRLWDDFAALVCDLNCGVLTAAEAIRSIEWDAAIGKIGVFDGATVLASQGGVWTPEAGAVTPLYVGSDSTPANAARCLIALLEGWDF